MFYINTADQPNIVWIFGDDYGERISQYLHAYSSQCLLPPSLISCDPVHHWSVINTNSI